MTSRQHIMATWLYMSLLVYHFAVRRPLHSPHRNSRKKPSKMIEYPEMNKSQSIFTER